MRPEQAKEYGIIDEIITGRKDQTKEDELEDLVE